jgi:hypothetical protein
VFASGGLRFYGDENAKRRGLGPRPERGTTDSPLNDEFSLDLRKDPQLRALYLDNEDIDGYHRDVDVFTAGITIEDNLSLVVDYTSGAAMSYSLNAHAPWEGYTVSINGTRGRAELTVVERGAVALDVGGRVLIDPGNSSACVLASDDQSAKELMKWLSIEPIVVTGILFGTPWEQGNLQPCDVSRLQLSDARVPHEARTLGEHP